MKIPIHSDIQISKSPIVRGFLRDWRREDITHITASGPRRCGKDCAYLDAAALLDREGAGLKGLCATVRSGYVA